MEDSALSYIYQEDLYRIPDIVTVVIPESWDQTSEEERTQLARILTFARLSMDNVRIIAASDLTRITHASVVLSFGVSARGLETYQLYETPGRKTIVADSLRKLTIESQSRQKLAACLKQALGL